VGAFNGTVGSIFFAEVTGEYRRSNHAFAWGYTAGFNGSGPLVAFGPAGRACRGYTSGYHFHTGANTDLCAENFNDTFCFGFPWGLDVQFPKGIHDRAVPENTGSGQVIYKDVFKGIYLIESQIINEILSYTPAFLLIAIRALAMIEVAPLFNSESVPQVVKISLAGFAAYASFSSALVRDWVIAPFGLSFVFLAIGEALIGIIIAFFIALIFAAFSTAGQFFSLQMGFGASETFDPLSQIENPLMGQYLNTVAMLIFVTVDGFRDLFLGGFWRSLQSINVMSLVAGRESIVSMVLAGLSRLFLDAIVISMPILGSLFLVSLSTGLISKAAPQINILSEGFPISITVAFILIYATLPFMTEAFSRVIGSGFQTLQTLYTQIGQRITVGGAL